MVFYITGPQTPIMGVGLNTILRHLKNSGRSR
ncbi:IS1-like element transposase [Raoultella planticola]